MKQILAATTFSVSPPVSSRPALSNSNSYSGIYMSNTSQNSFKNLPNIPPPPPGFENSSNTKESLNKNNSNNNSNSSLLYQNVPTNLSRTDSSSSSKKSSIKQRIKQNYDLFQQSLNRKFLSFHEFFHLYMYDNSDNENKTTSVPSIKPPAQKSSKEINKTSSITSNSSKQVDRSSLKSTNQTEYYQVNIKPTEQQNNLNLLKKSSFNLQKNKININSLVPKPKSSQDSSTDYDEFPYEEKPRKKTRLATLYSNQMAEASSSSLDSEGMNESDDSTSSFSYGSSDANSYYLRTSNGLSYNYMLYDIPEENDEETLENANIASNSDSVLRI